MRLPFSYILKLPSILFKSQNAWEQVELNEIADRSTLKNRKNENKIVLTNSAELGIVKQQDYFDKDIANSKNLSNYYVVKNNYFVYNPRISNQAKYGPINYNSLGIVGIMSPLYFVFKVHNVNNIFLGILFKTNVWHRFMYENGDTGARADRFSIKDSVFMTMPLNIPSIAEQSKVAKLFQSLDKTITLHEEKQRQLERLKKALLQKMFADKTGYPILRFKGFSDAWEQRRLKNVAKSNIGGGTPKTSVKEYWGGTLPWIQSSDLIEGELFDVHVKKHITEIGIENSAAKLIPKNSIAVVTRVGVGKLAFLPFEYATSQDFLSLNGVTENPWFITYALQLAIKKLVRQLQGTSIKGITKSELLKILIKVPLEMSEQEKVSKLLLSTDSLITLHQHKIDNLKRLKRALLQKMFV